jgi:SEC-C motif
VLGLAAASLVWLAVAPGYAWGLAAVARLAAPTLERTPGTRYEVAGSRVLAHRPVRLPNQERPRDVVYTLWLASGNFGLPMLAALIVATPGWSWYRRVRALGWGLGLLTLTQVAFLLVTLEFWQQMPIRGPEGRLVHLPGHSALGLRVASALYNFFEIMGRGFFALLVYLGLLMFTGAPRGAVSGAVGRNDACPCGSGRKFKRCCGTLTRQRAR